MFASFPQSRRQQQQQQQQRAAAAHAQAAKLRGQESTSRQPIIVDSRQEQDDYRDFLQHFYRDIIYKRSNEMRRLRQELYPELNELYQQLVIQQKLVSHEEFWQRYYYRCNMDRILEAANKAQQQQQQQQWDKQRVENDRVRSTTAAVQKSWKWLKNVDILKSLQGALLTAASQNSSSDDGDCNFDGEIVFFEKEMDNNNNNNYNNKVANGNNIDRLIMQKASWSQQQQVQPLAALDEASLCDDVDNDDTGDGKEAEEYNAVTPPPSTPVVSPAPTKISMQPTVTSECSSSSSSRNRSIHRDEDHQVQPLRQVNDDDFNGDDDDDDGNDSIACNSTGPFVVVVPPIIISSGNSDKSSLSLLPSNDGNGNGEMKKDIIIEANDNVGGSDTVDDESNTVNIRTQAKTEESNMPVEPCLTHNQGLRNNALYNVRWIDILVLVVVVLLLGVAFLSWFGFSLERGIIPLGWWFMSSTNPHQHSSSSSLQLQLFNRNDDNMATTGSSSSSRSTPHRQLPFSSLEETQTIGRGRYYQIQQHPHDEQQEQHYYYYYSPVYPRQLQEWWSFSITEWTTVFQPMVAIASNNGNQEFPSVVVQRQVTSSSITSGRGSYNRATTTTTTTTTTVIASSRYGGGIASFFDSAHRMR